MTNQTRTPVRQKEIFDTAAALFARRGYSRTSMRDLAEALGLQKSSLYHYFESKEELLHRLLDEFMDQALERLEALCSLPMDPAAKLSAYLRFYTTFYAGDRDRLSLLVNDLDCLGPARRKAVVGKEKRYLTIIKGIMRELKEAGLMRDIPIGVAVFAFYGMVHFTPKWYRNDGPVTPQQLGEIFQEIFSNGALLQPAAPKAARKRA
jgi:AcrR family transcriptional regulator